MQKYDHVKRVEVLKWDIEYWNSYIYSYKTGDIKCTAKQREIDIKMCEEELQKTIQKIKYEYDNFPEEFI